jgi:hypothetical protein
MEKLSGPNLIIFHSPKIRILEKSLSTEHVLIAYDLEIPWLGMKNLLRRLGYMPQVKVYGDGRDEIVV